MLTNFVWFKGAVSACCGLAAGRVDVSASSPFAPLHMVGSGLSVQPGKMDFVAHGPRVL